MKQRSATLIGRCRSRDCSLSMLWSAPVISRVSLFANPRVDLFISSRGLNNEPQRPATQWNSIQDIYLSTHVSHICCVRLYRWTYLKSTSILDIDRHYTAIVAHI